MNAQAHDAYDDDDDTAILGVRWQIRRPSPAIRRIIEMTGLSDVLPFGE